MSTVLSLILLQVYANMSYGWTYSLMALTVLITHLDTTVGGKPT
ncbi:MAG: hypothetical protein V3S24_10750 [Candidatus Tectomicrobia bacterium]|jgi:ABC-type transport system involved in Fe-S cluster assembly fused permease/ATPase subunit